MIDQLISQHGRRLYGLCMTLCRTKADADDLYQETWLRVVRHFGRYDPARPFEPWLTRICVNCHRTLLRRPRHEALDASVPAPASPDYTDLHAAIDSLPEKLRTCVILYYFRDLDLQQTAYALGLPEGTVKSRLHRARISLKEALDHEPL